MGSSYFGEPNMGNGRSGSSRKGKKSNSDKPKQPQRGLGVAQLEKIRLRNQMNSSFLDQEKDVRVLETTYPSVPPVSSSFSYSSTSQPSFGFHQNIMGYQMGMGEMGATEIRFGDHSQSSTVARWNHNQGILEMQYSAQPSVSRPPLDLNIEDSVQKKRRKDRCGSTGSSSQNSYSSETGEIDLELRLSL